MSRLPSNWQQMEFLALWKALNDPRRHPTPQVVIEAVMLAVRERGGCAPRARKPRTPGALRSTRAQ
jgi:hypothetical protein